VPSVWERPTPTALRPLCRIAFGFLSSMEGALRALFEEPELDLPRLRELTSRGVPDHLRANVWKYLLGYLPVRKSSRASAVASSREQYRVFLGEVVTKPQHDSDNDDVALTSQADTYGPHTPGAGASTSQGRASPVVAGASSTESEFRPTHLKRLEVMDDPLSHLTAPGIKAGRWEQWHLDEELRVEIDKDIQVRQRSTVGCLGRSECTALTQRTNPGFHFFVRKPI